MLVMVVDIVYAGDHEVLRRSRQISPVLKSTLGWHIGVMKRIDGGERGYAVGMWISRSQRPPLNRVSPFYPSQKDGSSDVDSGHTFICRAHNALHDGPPVHHIVIFWAKLEQRIVRFVVVGLQLRHEPLDRGSIAR